MDHNDSNSIKFPVSLIALVVIVSFVSGIFASTLTSGFIIPQFFAKVSGDQKTIEQKTYVEESQSIDAIKKVSPAVVSIVATQDLKIYKSAQFPFFDPFGNAFPGLKFQVPQQQQGGQEGKDYEIQQRKIGGGTGFIITDDGLIMTNRHVVSNEQLQYTVIINDGTEYDAEVVSIDPLNDLAVIQMIKSGERDKSKESRTKLKDLPIVELGDSNKLEVGQKVLAIGYALGEYQNTVTAGIISGKGRDITAGGGRGGAETLSGLLQTDTAINPGNSGGPLINLAGQVIGVNVAIDSTGSNIGFAIPVTEVKPVIDSVKKNGRIIRPTLGVRHLLLTKDSAKQLKIEVDHGALLVGDEAKGEFAVIPGSPADKAGLKIRDVILAVDGKNIDEGFSLQDAVRAHQPGDEVTLKVWRSGETLTVKVKLTEAKDTV